jgi:hypothetical protein
MAQAPIFMTLARRNAVEAILDPILLKFRIRNAFDAREIHIRDRVIVEKTGNKNKFSNAVLDCMFPKEKTPIKLVHYTKMDALRSIASSITNAFLSINSIANLRPAAAPFTKRTTPRPKDLH